MLSVLEKVTVFVRNNNFHPAVKLTSISGFVGCDWKEGAVPFGLHPVFVDTGF
jgi:hypothetical protein